MCFRGRVERRLLGCEGVSRSHTGYIRRRKRRRRTVTNQSMWIISPLELVGEQRWRGDSRIVRVRAAGTADPEAGP